MPSPPRESQSTRADTSPLRASVRSRALRADEPVRFWTAPRDFAIPARVRDPRGTVDELQRGVVVNAPRAR
jgi:hypothetical protein